MADQMRTIPVQVPSETLHATCGVLQARGTANGQLWATPQLLCGGGGRWKEAIIEGGVAGYRYHLHGGALWGLLATWG
jgi:hypothetical protein